MEKTYLPSIKPKNPNPYKQKTPNYDRSYCNFERRLINMDKLSSWLFVLIALLWIPQVASLVGGTVATWVAVIALAIIGLKGALGK